MLPARSRSTAPLRAPRRGVTWLGLALAIVLVGGLSGATWYGLGQHNWSQPAARPLTQQVTKGVYSHVVTEQGEIESSSNIEVRCEVQSRNTGGTSILDIVPEGTSVKKGERICRLDSSVLENERSQQQIAVNTAESTWIKAKSTLETAKIAREEYLEGTYKKEEQTIQSEISVAEENLSRAQDYAAYSRRLATKGYVTALQLEADEFAVAKAKMDLEAAKTKLDVLRKYSRAKMVTQLEADIEAAEAALSSAESTRLLEKDKLSLIESQIKKCEILAPADGQVVYANETNSGRGGGQEIIIQAGTAVRERQVIVRLPDPHKMQVKVRVNESRVDRVREGQSASIKLDAFPDEELQGVLTRVEAYPTSGNWWSNVKEYATYVRIENPPEGRLRPGMTAQVQIHVEYLEDALQTPVQAIVEHGGKHYCLVETAPHQLTPREVNIGSTNDKFVVITSGLEPADQIVLNPRKFLDQVSLPDLSDLEKSRQLARRPPPRAAGDVATATGNSASTPAENSAGDSPSTSETANAADATANANDSATTADGEKPRRKRGAGGAGGAGGMAGMDPTALAGMMMGRMDTDQDGKISKEEMPEGEGRDRFEQTDANHDGFVDTQELGAAIAKRMKQMQATGMGPGGPGPGGPPSGGGR